MAYTYVQEDFHTCLEAPLGRKVCDHLLDFRPLNKNNEWYLSFKTSEVKDRVLLGGELQAKSKSLRVNSADKRQFAVRVPWALAFVTNEATESEVGNFGEIKVISHKRNTGNI